MFAGNKKVGEIKLCSGLLHRVLSTKNFSSCFVMVGEGGQNSVVRIATCYRLEGPGIESQWGQDFPHLSRPALGPTQPPVQWVLGLSGGGVKAAGA
jgi:hypothetical protein